MKRSERWTEPRLVSPMIVNAANDSPLVMAIHAALKSFKGQDDLGEVGSFVRSARELILSVEDDGIHINFVCFTIDGSTGALSIQSTLDMRGFDDDDDVGVTLVRAILEDVPIYPEDQRAAARLAQIYQTLYDDGFSVMHEGRKARFKFKTHAAFQAESGTVDTSASLQPADFYIRAEQERQTLTELVEAERVLSMLRSAIEELTVELNREVRDENALQRILTSKPVLFGLQYRRIVPKHRLGGEYEMDYAAQTLTGLTDIIEIEASTHKLFTKAGNPRADLVHAEQQVLDWLQWMDDHHEYAVSNWPDLMRPRGVVVIGRRSEMSAEDRKRLDRRNVAWAESLQVMTYDDLLDRAKRMLDMLTSSSALCPHVDAGPQASDDA